jgi:hypothetical protein
VIELIGNKEIIMMYVGYKFKIDGAGIDFSETDGSNGIKMPEGYDVGEHFVLEVTPEGGLFLKRIERQGLH